MLKSQNIIERPDSSGQPEYLKKNHIVAIGASAGGLEALQSFLTHLPKIEDVAIVIAQHLSPSHKSLLVQLLSKATQNEVQEAEHGIMLKSGVVYITPPDKEIVIEHNTIHLSKPPAKIGPRPSVDKLFQSIASHKGGKIVAVVLSGTGTDGATSVAEVQYAGGLVILQDPSTAKYNGMPMASLQTGVQCQLLSPEKMGIVIKRFLQNEFIEEHIENNQIDDENGIAKILELLSLKTGTDFAKYKPATIKRRVFKRMHQLGIHAVHEYVSLLKQSTTEVDVMFNMILIGVTSFFRDPEAFVQIAQMLQKIIESKKPGDNIRLWVPGCSSGEEPYSLAMLLDDILGEKRSSFNIQIFASDIDDNAIAAGRKAVYAASVVDNVSPEFLARYFQLKGSEYEVVKSIRSMVLFSKHDLTQSPPFLKLDLISCRNLLIYFSASLQQQVIPLFHYALNPDGMLFLGKSESVGQYADLFEVSDSKNKIYKRKRGGALHVVKFSAYKPHRQSLPFPAVVAGKKEYSIPEMVKETLYNSFEYPYVVINEAYDIQEINGDIYPYFTLPQGSVQVNLLKMIHPELYITARAVLTKAITGNEAVKSGFRIFDLPGGKQYLQIRIKPVLYTEKSGNLFMVIVEKQEESILDAMQDSSQDLMHISDSIRVAELQSEIAATKESLQTYIEELETSNEELQSLNEELQSTNEELQSTNEELETTNEEMQSTNEEIQVAYAELKTAKEELERQEYLLKSNEANLKALLNNNLQSFVLVDTAYKIISFNPKAAQTFFELRHKSILLGESIIDVIEPSALQDFIQDFSKAVSGEVLSVEKCIKDVAGLYRFFVMNFTPVQFDVGATKGISISMLEITDLKHALNEVKESEALLGSVFNATSVGICITDAQGRFVRVNKQYCEMYGYKKEELLGASFLTVVPAEHHEYAQHQHDIFIETGCEMPGQWEVCKKDGTKMIVMVTAELLVNELDEKFKVTSVLDITDQMKAQQLVVASEKSFRLFFEENAIPCFIVATESCEIQSANHAALENYGYALEELNHMCFQDLVANEDFDFKEIKKNPKAEMHLFMRHRVKTGKEIDVELFGHEIVYNNESCIALICNNVSLQKELEIKITKAIIKAQEEERFQIGADLHDNICQLLAYAQMNMGMIRKNIQTSSTNWHLNASNAVQEALESVRNVSHQLAPAFIRDRPLKDALLMLLESLSATGAFKFAYFFDEAINKLPIEMEQKLNIYRILQEQIRNIQKHSSASLVTVKVNEENELLKLLIEDNGVGFESKNYEGGIGFANIKRRAELFGGSMVVSSRPGEGCKLFVTMHLSHNLISQYRLA